VARNLHDAPGFFAHLLAPLGDAGFIAATFRDQEIRGGAAQRYRAMFTE
jgi:hypothetical protein